jgi:hypothetical protein
MHTEIITNSFKDMAYIYLKKRGNIMNNISISRLSLLMAIALFCSTAAIAAAAVAQECHQRT